MYQMAGARPRPKHCRRGPVCRGRTHSDHMRHTPQTAVYRSCGIVDRSPRLAAWCGAFTYITVKVRQCPGNAPAARHHTTIWHQTTRHPPPAVAARPRPESRRPQGVPARMPAARRDAPPEIRRRQDRGVVKSSSKNLATAKLLEGYGAITNIRRRLNHIEQARHT